jgi:hypothetical protein
VNELKNTKISPAKPDLRAQAKCRGISEKRNGRAKPRDMSGYMLLAYGTVAKEN